MKIHAYKVTSERDHFPLELRLEQLVKTPLDERNRPVGTTKNFLRAEVIQQHGESIWMVDFVTIRMDHGPAKVSLNEPVEGFPLEDDEGFGEETGMMYDAKTGYAIIQYNHFGPRVGGIAEYLSLFEHTKPNMFVFAPKLTDDTASKLAAQKFFTKLELTVAPHELSKHDVENDISFRTAAILGQEIGARTVSLTLSAGRGHELSHALKATAKRIWDMIRFNMADAISVAKVHGKEDLSDKVEVIDLVAQRLALNADMKPGIDKRYPREQRWSALAQAKSHWKRLLKSDEPED